MKKFLLVALMSLVCNVIFCQTPVLKFTYDAAGNRISRDVIYLKTNEEINDTSAIIQPFTELLDEMNISIFPNPTKGELEIQIKNLVNGESKICEIYLYGMNGQMLLRDQVVNNRKKLDLSAFQSGMYLLRIEIDKHSREWKIIKE